jgi:L-alanine-DL-glutamate epimerase-like enolase superfamily enzyme
MLEADIQTIRCKLGCGVERDAAIVKAVREPTGPTAALRVECIQAYPANKALPWITAIAPYGIDFAGQPVPCDDFAGMAWLQSHQRSDHAHGPAFGSRDLFTLAKVGAVRCFGLDGERPGAAWRRR